MFIATKDIASALRRSAMLMLTCRSYGAKNDANSKLGAFTLQTFPAIMPCTCYQARKIFKLLVSLAIQLSAHRGVKRAEKCHT
jgi:hypothetical protein